MKNMKPNRKTTLDNGAGVYNIYTGQWIIDGTDVTYLGDVFNQYMQVDDDLFNKVVAAKKTGGDQAAWDVIHNQ